LKSLLFSKTIMLYGGQLIGMLVNKEKLFKNLEFIENTGKLLLMQIHLYGDKLTHKFDVNVLLFDDKLFELNPINNKQVDKDEN
jgi:hypothetical protein